jgi:hypothetical protein
MDCTAKVRELHLAVEADQQVLRLQVAMDHVLRVAVLKRLGKLVDQLLEMM